MLKYHVVDVSKTLTILENKILNFKFWNSILIPFPVTCVIIVSEFTSFSVFLLFKINSDGFLESCGTSYAVPGLSVIRLTAVSLQVVSFGYWLCVGPYPPRKSFKLPLRKDPNGDAGNLTRKHNVARIGRQYEMWGNQRSNHLRGNMLLRCSFVHDISTHTV